MGNGDEVAEWLRRWTANPLGSARVGSNPIFVAPPHWFYGVMVSTLDFESSDPNLNLGRTWHFDEENKITTKNLSTRESTWNLTLRQYLPQPLRYKYY